jgi:hippurate hydrolase
MMRISGASLLLAVAVVAQEPADLTSTIEAQVPEMLRLYQHLHANPELSFMEEKTSARLAEEMRAVGFEVTEKVGGWGVVAVFRNGPGRTVLVRTDMDALPVRELTGLPYASKGKTKDQEGKEVSVMHACGHDMHMACWVGTAKALLSLKQQWKGTLVFIGQPAEERGGGAEPMLKDGLFSRFPKPDVCLALHCGAETAAGSVAITFDGATANVDSVDIVVRGVGGHGAQPQTTKDPVVLASQIVLALQTIASREVHPLEPVVVTVGSIHGGTKHNIIPESVTLQLTVRTVSDKTRQQVLESIRRIARGQGIAAGLPEDLLPEVKTSETFTPVVMNDDTIARRLLELFKKQFGTERVKERKPTMGGEDFSRYGMTKEKVPICMFWLGATEAGQVAEAQRNQRPLPSLHSPFFRPDAEPTLATGMEAMTLAVLEMLKPVP